MPFVDTNVLLYAVSSDQEERKKARLADEILGRRDVMLSVQVLQEFYVQATRSTRPDSLTHTQASRLVESFLRFPVQETTVEVVLAAMESSRRFQIPYWDAAILEASRAIGCELVLSEGSERRRGVRRRQGREPVPLTAYSPNRWRTVR